MTALHLIDLGAPVEEGVLRELLQAQRGSELVRGILQTMRDTALDAVTTKAREGMEAEKEIPQDRMDAWLHMQHGRAAALEDMVNHFMTLMTPAKKSEASDGKDGEEESMLGGPVPTE